MNIVELIGWYAILWFGYKGICWYSEQRAAHKKLIQAIQDREMRRRSEEWFKHHKE